MARNENWGSMTLEEKKADIEPVVAGPRFAWLITNALARGDEAIPQRRLAERVRSGILAMKNEKYPPHSDIEDLEDILEVTCNLDGLSVNRAALAKNVKAVKAMLAKRATVMMKQGLPN